MAIPVELPVGGTANASGNATISKVIRSAYWTLVYATCQAAGSGKWVFGPNTTARLFQSGANVVLGPIVLAPGDQASVQLAGATAGAQVTVTFWGWQGTANDGSDLAGLLSSIESIGSLTGITGPVTIGGTVPVSDGGLANSIAAAGSQAKLLTTQALTAGATTTINAGTGTAIPYPAGAASWLCQITGLGGGVNGVRLFVQYMDAAANILFKRQNDSSNIVYSTISGGGTLPTEAIQWQFTLPAGATGVTARIYATATRLNDFWYDTAIWEPSQPGRGGSGDQLGFDGVLWSVNASVFGPNANASYKLPTYTGPVLLGIQSSGAMHGSFGEQDYLSTLIRNLQNFPVSTSGSAQQSSVFWLPWLSNQITLFNDTAANNTVYAELRAIQS